MFEKGKGPQLNEMSIGISYSATKIFQRQWC
jgi:hypothetical protein